MFNIQLAFCAVLAGTLAQSFSARADDVLWYNGDWNYSTATANEVTTDYGSFYTYDDFKVTAPGGWHVTRAWSNNAMSFTGVSQASWLIRSGMATGYGGTIVSSGIGLATQTATGRYNQNLGYLEYTIEVSGLNLDLAPGTYWLSVSPLVGSEPGGHLKSYNSFTSGAGAAGMPAGNNGNSFFDSAWYGFDFVNGQADFSLGIAGTVIPEPSAWLLVSAGASFVLLGRRQRATGARFNIKPKEFNL